MGFELRHCWYISESSRQWVPTIWCHETGRTFSEDSETVRKYGEMKKDKELNTRQNSGRQESRSCTVSFFLRVASEVP